MEKLSGESLVKLLINRGVSLNMYETQFVVDFVNCITNLSKKLDEQNLLLKPVLDFDDACRYLKFSPSNLYKFTSLKQIPHYCPQGKKLYFNREELDQWLLRNRQTSGDEIEAAAIDYIIKNKRRR